MRVPATERDLERMKIDLDRKLFEGGARLAGPCEIRRELLSQALGKYKNTTPLVNHDLYKKCENSRDKYSKKFYVRGNFPISMHHVLNQEREKD